MPQTTERISPLVKAFTCLLCCSLPSNSEQLRNIKSQDTAFFSLLHVWHLLGKDVFRAAGCKFFWEWKYPTTNKWSLLEHLSLYFHHLLTLALGELQKLGKMVVVEHRIQSPPNSPWITVHPHPTANCCCCWAAWQGGQSILATPLLREGLKIKNDPTHHPELPSLDGIPLSASTCARTDYPGLMGPFQSLLEVGRRDGGRLIDSVKQPAWC